MGGVVNLTVKSCGCKRSELVRAFKTSHNSTKTRLYHIYTGAKSRCRQGKLNEKHAYYGIKFLWESFEDFKKDMGDSYDLHVKNHGEFQTTLDRTDNLKDYFKENCRWATYQEQGRNKRSVKLVNYLGQVMTLGELSKIVGVNAQTIWRRLKKGVSLESAVLNIHMPKNYEKRYK